MVAWERHGGQLLCRFSVHGFGGERPLLRAKQLCPKILPKSGIYCHCRSRKDTLLDRRFAGRNKSSWPSADIALHKAPVLEFEADLGFSPV